MKKKAQVWVETAIYTLIGLTIIGIVLGIATPSINKYKDKILLEQTTDALNDLNGKILETVLTGIGNRRIIDFRLKKGILILDAESNTITYTLEETKLEYSEIGIPVKQGDITVLQEENGREYNIKLILEFDSIDITYDGEEEQKQISAASAPYSVSIENKETDGDKPLVNIIIR